MWMDLADPWLSAISNRREIPFAVVGELPIKRDMGLTKLLHSVMPYPFEEPWPVGSDPAGPDEFIVHVVAAPSVLFELSDDDI